MTKIDDLLGKIVSVGNKFLPNNPINKLTQINNTLKNNTTLQNVQKIDPTVWKDTNGNQVSIVDTIKNTSTSNLLAGKINATPSVNQTKFNNLYSNIQDKVASTTSSNGKQNFYGNLTTAIHNNQQQESMLNSLQKAFYNTDGTLTREEINQWINDSGIKNTFPKVNADDILSLQSEITPILKQSGQYIDNAQIAERYPNLYNKKNIEELTQKSQDAQNKWQELVDKVSKANPNVLSDAGVSLYNFIQDSKRIPEQIREQYNVSSNVTDAELVSTVWANDETWKERYEIVKRKKSKMNAEDRGQLGLSSKFESFVNDLFKWMFINPALVNTSFNQGVNMLKNAWEENVQPFIDRGRQENPGTFDWIGRGTNAVADVASMPGNLLSGLSKISNNATKITSFNTDKSLKENFNEKTGELIKLGGGTIETLFNTALAPVTALFHIAGEVPVAGDILNWGFGLIPNAVDYILSGKWRGNNVGATSGENQELPVESWISDWYNNGLDDEARQDLQNEVFLLVAHKISKSEKLKKLGADSTAFGKTLIEAIQDAFQAGKYASSLDLWLKRQQRGGNVYEERYGLPGGEDGNPPRGGAMTVDTGEFKEGKNTFGDVVDSAKTGIQAGLGRFVDNLKTGSEFNRRLDQRLNKITADREKAKVTEGVKEEVGDLENEIRRGNNIGGQLADLQTKVDENVRNEEIAKGLRKPTTTFDSIKEKFTGLDDATREQIKKNPFATDEVRRIIEALESDEGLDFGEYEIGRYQEALNTIIKKIDEIETKRTGDIGPLYQLLEQINTPVDTSNLLGDLSSFVRDLSENVSSGEKNKINEILDRVREGNIDDISALWELRKLADKYSNWEANSTTEGINAIRGIRDRIDSIIRDQVPEFKEVDSSYVQVLKDLQDLRGKLYTKKNGKFQLRDNAVSTVKNLLNPANRLYLERLEKHIPGLTQYLNGLKQIKKVYNVYTTGNGSRFISGIAQAIGGKIGRIVGALAGGAGGFFLGALADGTIDTFMKNFTKKAIKDTLTKMTPEGIKELQKIADKVKAGKELTKAEKARLKELSKKIIEEGKRRAETKAEKEYWEKVEKAQQKFNESVENDNRKNKLTDQRKPGDKGKTEVTGDATNIVVDEEGNARRKGQIGESDKRSEENKKNGYVNKEQQQLAKVDNAQRKLQAGLDRIGDNFEEGQRKALTKDVEDLRREIKIAEENGYEVPQEVRDTLVKAEGILGKGSKNSQQDIQTGDISNPKTPITGGSRTAVTGGAKTETGTKPKEEGGVKVKGKEQDGETPQGKAKQIVKGGQKTGSTGLTTTDGGKGKNKQMVTKGTGKMSPKKKKEILDRNDGELRRSSGSFKWVTKDGVISLTNEEGEEKLKSTFLSAFKNGLYIEFVYPKDGERISTIITDDNADLLDNEDGDMLNGKSVKDMNVELRNGEYVDIIFDDENGKEPSISFSLEDLLNNAWRDALLYADKSEVKEEPKGKSKTIITDPQQEDLKNMPNTEDVEDWDNAIGDLKKWEEEEVKKLENEMSTKLTGLKNEVNTKPSETGGVVSSPTKIFDHISSTLKGKKKVSKGALGKIRVNEVTNPDGTKVEFMEAPSTSITKAFFIRIIPEGVSPTNFTILKIGEGEPQIRVNGTEVNLDQAHINKLQRIINGENYKDVMESKNDNTSPEQVKLKDTVTAKRRREKPKDILTNPKRNPVKKFKEEKGKDSSKYDSLDDEIRREDPKTENDYVGTVADIIQWAVDNKDFSMDLRWDGNYRIIYEDSKGNIRYVNDGADKATMIKIDGDLKEYADWLENNPDYRAYLPQPLGIKDYAEQRKNEKAYEKEATKEFEEGEWSLLPEDESVSNERAKPKTALKRIAPDRVFWQQLTMEEGINKVYEAMQPAVDYMRLSRENRYSSEWFQAQREAQKFWFYRGLGFKSNKSKQFNDLYKKISNAIGNEHALREVAKEIYIDRVKKDIGDGYAYPQEIYDAVPGAMSAKEKYLAYIKGWNTSFSQNDTRKDTSLRDIIGTDLKRQDGKAVTQEFRDYIRDGLTKYGRGLGLDIKRLNEDLGIIFIDLNGKNPFLRKGVLGQYRSDTRSLSVHGKGEEYVVKGEDGKEEKKIVPTTLAHEYTHAIDAIINWKLLPSEVKEALKNTINSKLLRYDSYWGSPKEVTARVVEQYVAVKEGLGDQFFGMPQFWDKDTFEQIIVPAVEQAFSDKLGDYYKDPTEIKYQTKLKGDEKTINAIEGLMLKNFLDGRTVEQIAKERGFRVETVKQILTKKGLEAYGSYGNMIIRLAEKIKNNTAPHELFHALFDLVDKEEKERILDDVMKLKGMNRRESEEWLADNFAEYFSTGKLLPEVELPGWDNIEIDRKLFDDIKKEKGFKTDKEVIEFFKRNGDNIEFSTEYRQLSKELQHRILEFFIKVKATVNELYKKREQYKQLFKDLLNGQKGARHLDNQGFGMSHAMYEYMKKSKARVDEDIDKPLVQAFHTTTGDFMRPFTVFNPVGTRGYRFDDNFVAYFSDSKDMSGSYAEQSYTEYKGRKFNSMAELQDFIDEINKRSQSKYLIEDIRPGYTDGNGSGKYLIMEKVLTDKTIKQIEKYFKDNPGMKEIFEKGVYQRDYEWNLMKQNLSADEFNKEMDKRKEAHENLRKYQLEDTSRFFELGLLRTYVKTKEFGTLGKEMIPNGRYEDLDELLRNGGDDLLVEVSSISKYQYAGYLNIENPYIIDAQGGSWNNIDQGYSRVFQLILDTINGWSEEEKEKNIQIAKDAIKEYEEDDDEGKNWNEYIMNMNDSLQGVMSELLPDEVSEWLADSDWLADPILEQIVYGIADNFNKNKLGLALVSMGFAKGKTTNDIVWEIIEKNKKGANYDGIIIKNVVDYGGKSYEGNKPHNVYVIFSPEQFKSKYNVFPTKDPDIRYQEKKGINKSKTKLTDNKKNKLTNLYKDVVNEIKERWLGKGEDGRKNMEKILSMDSVSELKGDEFEKIDNTSLVDRIYDYYKKINNKVYRKEIGTIYLTRKGIKSSIGHGLGRNKTIAFKAVPEIIKEGILTTIIENRKGDGYDSYAIIAPITIKGEKYLGIVSIKKLPGGKKGEFYLHEVVLEDSLK